MKGLPKPTRRPRLARPEGRTEVHDEGHSWAVSYADFLMVLLSFFILFFSVDDSKREELIDRIAGVTTTEKGGQNAAGRDRTNVKTPSLPAGLDNIATGVEGFYIQRANNSQKLFINLEDNIFKPGKVDLPADEIEKFQKILAKIAPYMNEINLTFEGHTDGQAVTHVRNEYLSNNFDLSSLRATKALQLAVRSGLDPAKMYAKGVAEHARGTRTLTLVITPSEVRQ